MSKEQESAAEQQPVLHLHSQPEASEGHGPGMALAAPGEHQRHCKAESSISHCPTDGGNSPALEQGQTGGFLETGSSRVQGFI